MTSRYNEKVIMGRVSDAKERLMRAVGELIWTGSYGATTIDQICEKADVRKGSFYYFFDSKADLAVAAIEEDQQRRRAELDAIFSPTVPPLERIRNYCGYVYQLQAEMKAKCGRVLGCPLYTLGSEVCTQDLVLQKQIQEILDQKLKYLESAIRDAHAEGLIHAPDVPAKARMVFTYYQGLLTEARIRNDLHFLRDAPRRMNELLGVMEPASVAP